MTRKIRQHAEGTDRHTITVDRLTDLAVKLVMQREGLSYSVAMCSMTMAAALTEPDIRAAITAEVHHQALDRVQYSTGTFSLDFSERLAEELLAVNEGD